MKPRLRTSAMVAGLLAAAVLAAPSAQGQSGQPDCSWMQGDKSPEQRADELIAAMTLEQKLHQVTFSNPPWFTHYGTAGHVDGTPELCIPTMVLSDAGSGVAGLQQGTTTFPSGVSQAATWDTRLERRFGAAVGQEAWNKGINVMLAPGFNIARIATNGRNFEYMGEDPFLAGKIATAAVRGIQSENVLAQPKHYAANNQEADRMVVDARVKERVLREIYLPAFERVIKEGNAASVMCSYNRLNGNYACENKELLDGYLRRDWGFDGFVTSDWGATHSTVASVKAGMDLEMHAAPPNYYGEPLAEAVANGEVSVSRLDEMLRHIFVPMFRFGLFDEPPITQPLAYTNQAATPEHRALARQMSISGTVLLKNAGEVLPLDEGSNRTIAVIGYAAGLGASSSSAGGGSSHGSGVPFAVTPVEGMQTLAAAHGDQVIYVDGSSQADAIAAASAADVAIVFAADTATEGGDRADLSMHPGACASLFCGPLPIDQEAVIEAVAGANENTVVVLDAGAPVEMPWLDDVKAVLDAFYPGTENGNAIASLLYGEANPSGKLPQTFPRSLEQMPTRTPEQYPGVDGTAVYSEGLEVGYRWFDAQKIKPLFPFGYGLSYTTFRYSQLKARPLQGGRAVLRFRITNTGDRVGAEVAQVYVGFPERDGEPPRQLKGFRKVTIAPGKTRRVIVRLDRRSFQHWSSRRSRWVATPGCYGIAVGGSSRDLPLRAEVPVRLGAAGSGACARLNQR